MIALILMGLACWFGNAPAWGWAACLALAILLEDGRHR